MHLNKKKVKNRKSTKKEILSSKPNATLITYWLNERFDYLDELLKNAAMEKSYNPYKIMVDMIDCNLL